MLPCSALEDVEIDKRQEDVLGIGSDGAEHVIVWCGFQKSIQEERIPIIQRTDLFALRLPLSEAAVWLLLWSLAKTVFDGECEQPASLLGVKNSVFLVNDPSKVHGFVDFGVSGPLCKAESGVFLVIFLLV
ncbi:hypothetical protein SDC9_102527 [bioreactor metagenome]|uniref:Uncharacterized protein n=1 Tax=bioreactor metagenome TaxID=1076179 RepID=A0A645ARK3_9ZZZZ